DALRVRSATRRSRRSGTPAPPASLISIRLILPRLARGRARIRMPEMDPASVIELVAMGFAALMVAFGGLRQVNEWETGLKFTLGRFSGRIGPGLNFVVPGVQRMVRLDMRVRNRDLPQQSVITADNVTAWIDAVIYYKVVDAEKATLNVQNYE